MAKRKVKSKKKIKNKKKPRLVRRSKKKIKNKKIKSQSIKKNTTDEELIIKVSKNWSKKAYANKNSYQKKYNHSVKKNEDFWRKEGKR